MQVVLRTELSCNFYLLFQLCRRVWLGLYDNRSHIDLDAKDENKIKDFMTQKYERKRYYVAPTESMYEESRQLNSSAAEISGKKPSAVAMMNRNKTPQQVRYKDDQTLGRKF